MRLNAAYMKHEDYHYMIRDYNGNDIHYCTIVDTDQGYAICAITVPTGYKTEDDVLKYRPLFTYDENSNNETMHEYTLYSFELWDTATNTLVARV